MKIKINSIKDLQSELSIEEFEALEGARLVSSVPGLARFAIDDKGKPIEYDTALKLLRKEKMAAVNDLLIEFWKQVSELSVNPPSGAN